MIRRGKSSRGSGEEMMSLLGGLVSRLWKERRALNLAPLLPQCLRCTPVVMEDVWASLVVYNS